MIFVSGGALGADSVWSYYGEQAGIKCYHLIGFDLNRPKGGSPERQAEQASGKNVYLNYNQHLHAVEELKKLDVEISGVKASEYFKGSISTPKKLHARNYFQVINGDQVLAIVPLVNGKPTGGTATAINTAIKLDKPVYVLNTEDCSWYTYTEGNFIKCGKPVLKERNTTIGSRALVKYQTRVNGQWVDAPYIGEEKETKIREMIKELINED